MPLSKQVTAEILDSISEGIFTVDTSFRINFFNRAAEKITGMQREEVLGKFCKSVCRSELCKDRCPISHVLQTGEDVVNLDSHIRHKSGKIMNIRMNATVLRQKNNEPIGGVISFRDVTYLEKIKKDLDKQTQFFGMLGHSKQMQEIFDLIKEISDSDAAVLIQGPSGTGKEMIANAIQASSLRKDKPFIKINCSVFSPQLLASELFGHVKGAFTGADRDRRGRFEIAHTGTIFLDEVAEMPLQMQLQLLRVLQEGTFERVGESVTHTVDVRIIAATNVDLEQALAQGKFREDLYYRLNVIPIRVPALEERPEDIPYLIKHFIDKYALLRKKNIREIDDDALDLLIKYPWPGNVRELENAIEYAFARTRDEQIIQICKLPPHIRSTVPCQKPINWKNSAVEEAQKIRELLTRHQWNRSQVARELGIGRTTLWRKLKQYQIENAE